MKILTNKVVNLKPLYFLTLFLSFLFSQNAIAATTPTGNMNFTIPAAGGATSIPTLSSTMLIVLSLLLFIVAFRVSKQSGVKTNKLFVSLLGVFALSSGIGGLKALEDVHAGSIFTPEAITLTLATGATTGAVGLFGPDTQYFDNSFGVPVTITSIEVFSGFICDNPIPTDTVLTKPAAKPAILGSPVCSYIAPNNIIPVDAQCQLTCSSLIMFSDERLKNSIKPLFKLNNNIQLYSFKYNNDKSKTYVGAMAQDLLKDPRHTHSVKKMPNDFYGVNYQSLGLKMITLEQWLASPNNIFID